MQFKKGDIVEVTEEDRWYGQNYYIGTRWVVVYTTHNFVIVKDDRQDDGKGTIVKFKVKLIEEEKQMLKFKEGQTYICTESHDTWWTEGKEYPVIYNDFGMSSIKDNRGTFWEDYELNMLLHKFKLKEENQMLKFKEGQTYICTQSNHFWWTVGKEYVVSLYDNSVPYLTDDNGGKWTAKHLTNRSNQFKLKEETTMTDLIDNQPHYKNQGIEPIELMRKNFSKEEFAGFLQGNVLKYMLRYKDKNGLEDLKKAKTYLTWLIQEEENAKV